MRSPRLTLAVTALAAALALTACSGSDDSEPDADASPSASTSESPEAAAPFERPCTVQVDLTGAVEVSWAGKGTASNEAGPTIYLSQDGDSHLTVFAGTDDIQTNANVTVDGATYTTTDPEAGLDVAGNGTKAAVDADTTGVDGPGPHIKATFTCGKDKGKAKG